jgi:hypothetical protein
LPFALSCSAIEDGTINLSIRRSFLRHPEIISLKRAVRKFKTRKMSRCD